MWCAFAGLARGAKKKAAPSDTKHFLRSLKESAYYERRKRKAQDDNEPLPLGSLQLRCRVCSRRTTAFCPACSDPTSENPRDLHMYCRPTARHRRLCFEEHHRALSSATKIQKVAGAKPSSVTASVATVSSSAAKTSAKVVATPAASSSSSSASS